MERPCACRYEHNAHQRTDHNDNADDTIDNPYSTDIETHSQLVYHVCYKQPPQHSTSKNGEITDALVKQRHIGQHEIERSEQSHEEQQNQRIRQCYEEASYSVMQQVALVAAHITSILHRICAVCMDTEDEHHHSTNYLHPEQSTRIAYEFVKERKTVTGEQSVKNIAQSRTCTCNDAIYPAFVKGPLHTQNPDRSHGSRCYNTDNCSFDDNLKERYLGNYGIEQFVYLIHNAKLPFFYGFSHI